MPFAVHWNPSGTNKKIAQIALFAKMAFFQFLNDVTVTFLFELL